MREADTGWNKFNKKHRFQSWQKLMNQMLDHIKYKLKTERSSLCFYEERNHLYITDSPISGV